MALDQETQNWVDEMKSAGVSDAVIGALTSEAEKNDKIKNALKGSVSATKDYQRRMDLVAKQDKDAQDLVKANTALQQELTRWKREEVDPTLTKANAIMAEMAALKARVSERAKVLKDKYSIDDAEVADLLETSTTIVKKAAKEADATVDDDGRFKKMDEDFNKVARSMPRLAARLEKLGRQFDKLFDGTGKEFDPDLVLDLAEKENTTLDAAFAKLYDVSARQTELSNIAKEKEFADRLKVKEAEWQAKQGTPGPGTARPGEEGTPLTELLSRHKDKDKDGGAKAENAPNPIDRVRQAAHQTAPADAVNRYVSNFRSGKFKGDKAIAVEAGA